MQHLNERLQLLLAIRQKFQTIDKSQLAASLADGEIRELIGKLSQGGWRLHADIAKKAWDQVIVASAVPISGEIPNDINSLPAGLFQDFCSTLLTLSTAEFKLLLKKLDNLVNKIIDPDAESDNEEEEVREEDTNGHQAGNSLGSKLLRSLSSRIPLTVNTLNQLIFPETTDAPGINFLELLRWFHKNQTTVQISPTEWLAHFDAEEHPEINGLIQSASLDISKITPTILEGLKKLLNDVLLPDPTFQADIIGKSIFLTLEKLLGADPAIGFIHLLRSLIANNNDQVPNYLRFLGSAEIFAPAQYSRIRSLITDPSRNVPDRLTRSEKTAISALMFKLLDKRDFQKVISNVAMTKDRLNQFMQTEHETADNPSNNYTNLVRGMFNNSGGAPSWAKFYPNRDINVSPATMRNLLANPEFQKAIYDIYTTQQEMQQHISRDTTSAEPWHTQLILVCGVIRNFINKNFSELPPIDANSFESAWYTVAQLQPTVANPLNSTLVNRIKMLRTIIGHYLGVNLEDSSQVFPAHYEPILKIIIGNALHVEQKLSAETAQQLQTLLADLSGNSNFQNDLKNITHIVEKVESFIGPAETLDKPGVNYFNLIRTIIQNHRMELTQWLDTLNANNQYSDIIQKISDPATDITTLQLSSDQLTQLKSLFLRLLPNVQFQETLHSAITVAEAAKQYMDPNVNKGEEIQFLAFLRRLSGNCIAPMLNFDAQKNPIAYHLIWQLIKDPKAIETLTDTQLTILYAALPQLRGTLDGLKLFIPVLRNMVISYAIPNLAALEQSNPELYTLVWNAVADPNFEFNSLHLSPAHKAGIKKLSADLQTDFVFLQAVKDNYINSDHRQELYKKFLSHIHGIIAADNQTATGVTQLLWGYFRFMFSGIGKIVIPKELDELITDPVLRKIIFEADGNIPENLSFDQITQLTNLLHKVATEKSFQDYFGTHHKKDARVDFIVYMISAGLGGIVLLEFIFNNALAFRANYLVLTGTELPKTLVDMFAWCSFLLNFPFNATIFKKFADFISKFINDISAILKHYSFLLTTLLLPARAGLELGIWFFGAISALGYIVQAQGATWSFWPVVVCYIINEIAGIYGFKGPIDHLTEMWHINPDFFTFKNLAIRTFLLLLATGFSSMALIPYGFLARDAVSFIPAFLSFLIPLLSWVPILCAIGLIALFVYDCVFKGDYKIPATVDEWLLALAATVSGLNPATAMSTLALEHGYGAFTIWWAFLATGVINFLGSAIWQVIKEKFVSGFGDLLKPIMDSIASMWSTITAVVGPTPIGTVISQIWNIVTFIPLLIWKCLPKGEQKVAFYSANKEVLDSLIKELSKNGQLPSEMQALLDEIREELYKAPEPEVFEVVVDDSYGEKYGAVLMNLSSASFDAPTPSGLDKAAASFGSTLHAWMSDAKSNGADAHGGLTEKTPLVSGNGQHTAVDIETIEDNSCAPSCAPWSWCSNAV